MDCTLVLDQIYNIRFYVYFFVELFSGCCVDDVKIHLLRLLLFTDANLLELIIITNNASLYYKQ